MKYLTLILGIISLVGTLMLFSPIGAPAQVSGYRFHTTSYGGPLSASALFLSFADCNAARNELWQGYPMSQCRVSN